MGYKVQIGLSNKHLHLKEEDIEILFGKGHKLTPTKDLVQPGQFACEEKVDIVGPKATLKGIRDILLFPFVSIKRVSFRHKYRQIPNQDFFEYILYSVLPELRSW